MKKSTKSFLLKLPAEILLIGSLLASIYVKFFTTTNISWGAIILLLIINVSYFIERFLYKRNMWAI